LIGLPQVVEHARGVDERAQRPARLEVARRARHLFVLRRRAARGLPGGEAAVEHRRRVVS